MSVSKSIVLKRVTIKTTELSESTHERVERNELNNIEQSSVSRANHLVVP